jgi:hypothetical protein
MRSTNRLNIFINGAIADLEWILFLRHMSSPFISKLVEMWGIDPPVKNLITAR